MKETDHGFRLKDGTLSTCREDGIVQIENTEVTPREVLELAAHVERCQLLNRAHRKKRR